MDLNKLYDRYRSLRQHEIQHYDRYNELLLIHSSSAMEGSTLTMEETEMLIEENATPEGKPLEHSLMIKDHYEALQYIIGQAQTIENIDEPVIRKIGALVMKSTGGEYHSALGTIDSRQGDFRRSASRAAGGSYYVSHHKIKPMMSELLKNINESMPKITSIGEALTVSSYAHLQLLTIHPFADGNGRTARLLQNLILLKRQYPLLIISHEKKARYIDAIKAARTKEDIAPFRAFLEEQYANHLQSEMEKIQAMNEGKSKGTTFKI